MNTDQPITVQNADSVYTLPPPPPPKEINGFISETLKEEDDQEIIIEDSLKQIEEETKAVDGADNVVDDYVSDQVMKEEQSLDREYSAVAASSDGEPEATAIEEEEEVDPALEVKEELEEEKSIEAELLEKSIEAELPVSLDRGVDDCHYETHESENSGGNQEGTNQLVNHSSWKDCCGLFDVLRQRFNQ